MKKTVDGSYICQISGCINDAQEYHYPITNEGDKAQKAYYCDFHASRAGFCPGCREFWGGVESFEFPLEPLLQGYCQDCRNSLKHEAPAFWGLDDDEEYEEDYYY